MTEGTASPGRGESIVFRQTGTVGGMLPIVIVNTLLNIVTLSLWRFWGRTRVRRYLWSTTQINGERAEYTGTGWEMFRAFLVVLFAIFLPLYVVIVAGQLLLPPELFLVIFGIAYIPLLIFIYWLFGMAIWLARRYRLSRTRWRGIRFGMAGSANGYAWAWIGYGLLTVVTLGWYAPAAEMRLFRRLWKESYVGDRPFKMLQGDEGLAGPLYGWFALAWFGALGGYFVMIAIVFTMNPGIVIGDFEMVSYIVSIYVGLFAYIAIAGLLGVAYFAALWRRQAEVLGLEGLAFALDARMWSLLWLYVGNVLIVVFTLGFGGPFAELRTAHYVFGRLSAKGTIDLESVRQTADKGPKSGEGLADFFDIGGAF
jgi:uncharacterized membrane protein YjgN (DUF898 family)